MRGRKPVPTSLKLLRGNPGKRALNPDEPQPDVMLPPAPSDLTGAAMTEWNERGPILERLGLITESDIPAFESYCRNWGRYKDAEEKLAKYGDLIKAQNGNLMQNPLLGVSNRALAKCQQFWSEFGMMPASRSRVRVQKGPAKPQSKLGEFLKRAK